MILGLLYNVFSKVMDYFGRRRIIYDRVGDEPYLERYYIFLKDRKNFPFNIFLHRFLKSDPDDLHNHPWRWRTFILSGGYWEYTEFGKFWRAPLTYRCAEPNTFHRIELDKNVPYCWTLFIPSLNVQDWGFKTKNGWVNHEKYFEMKKLEKENEKENDKDGLNEDLKPDLKLESNEENKILVENLEEKMDQIEKLKEFINIEENELAKLKDEIQKEIEDETDEDKKIILNKLNIKMKEA